jgi:hypothetical protein
MGLLFLNPPQMQKVNSRMFFVEKKLGGSAKKCIFAAR